MPGDRLAVDALRSDLGLPDAVLIRDEARKGCPWSRSAHGWAAVLAKGGYCGDRLRGLYANREPVHRN